MKKIFRVRHPEPIDVVDAEDVPMTAPERDEMIQEQTDVTAEPASSPGRDGDQRSPTMEAEDAEAAQPVEQPVAEKGAQPVRSDRPTTPSASPDEDVAQVWVNQYVIPEMETILAEIHDLEESIRELERQKAELEKRANQRAILRNMLLTGRGLPLKRAVQYVFSEFGVSVTSGPKDRSDIVLTYGGLDFVTDVVASEGPMTLAEIRQLNHRVEEFIEQHGRQPKGLLVANPFAHLPLAERMAEGRIAFPDQLRLLAEERYKFCLLTTPQLFVAYCKFKEGQLDVGEFMTELFETLWVYGNHRDIERFKVTTEVA